MVFVDRKLECVDCGTDFLFSAGEQHFFYENHFANEPKRCKLCKWKHKGRAEYRTETRITCAGCGIEASVPFKPTQGTPVLCRSCFQKAQPRFPN
ncbi:MAG: zinc-ribbon domain containing protein [Terracidiphilus sp.]